MTVVRRIALVVLLAGLIALSAIYAPEEAVKFIYTEF
jgi:hypothetical protein